MTPYNKINIIIQHWNHIKDNKILTLPPESSLRLTLCGSSSMADGDLQQAQSDHQYQLVTSDEIIQICVRRQSQKASYPVRYEACDTVEV
jgi:hypothetical protein